MLGFSFNSLCRGWSDTEATTGWTEGKPCEKAWKSSVGKERDGSVDRVDGRETVGNSLGESAVGKERDGSDDRVDGGEAVGNSLGRSRCEGARLKRRQDGCRGKV